MYLGGAAAGILESPDLGSLEGPFPAEVEQFLDEVRTAPDKHPRLLMAVSNNLNQLPVETLAEILRRDRPLVSKAIKDSPDSKNLLEGLRIELAVIRINLSSNDQKFAKQFDAMVDLSNRVEAAFSCVVTWRRLRKHFPGTPKQPLENHIRRGRQFLEDPEFQGSFPRLAREIKASFFPRIIWLNIGLDLATWSTVNKQDHEQFKKLAADECKLRRDAAKAAAAIQGLATPTLGQPQKPVELDIGPAFFTWKLPRLACTAAQLDKISAIMGRTMTKDAVRAAILEAGKKAQDLGNDAWFALHRNRLPADVEKLFSECFGVASTARPTGGATMHRIAVARYEGAIAKLGDDDVNLSCWGWPWGGLSSKDEPENYFAKNPARRFGIGLGRKFWAAVRDGDSLSTAAVLLAMALGIFYYRIRPGATTPRTVRAQCYLRFAIVAGGRAVPGWLESRCAPA